MDKHYKTWMLFAFICFEPFTQHWFDVWQWFWADSGSDVSWPVNMSLKLPAMVDDRRGARRLDGISHTQRRTSNLYDKKQHNISVWHQIIWEIGEIFNDAKFIEEVMHW